MDYGRLCPNEQGAGILFVARPLFGGCRKAEIVWYSPAAAKVPVVVGFWVPWCGRCRMAAPEAQELAREMGKRDLVLEVNTEEYPTLATQFRVQSIS